MTNLSFADSHFFLDLSGGYDFGIQNSTTSNNSNRKVFAGDEVNGLYQLQDVTWKNDDEDGFDGSLGVGFKFDRWHWSFEFLYQNLQRDINGHFTAVQLDADGGDVFSPAIIDIPHSENRLWVYSLMLNAYYDFKINAKWNPFVGGGIGVAWVNSESTSVHNTMTLDNTTDDTATTINLIEKSPTISGVPFAWQIKGGIAYNVNENLSIVGQYRLFGTTDLSSGSSTIIASPDTASPTTFYVKGKEVKGLLLNSLELGLWYVV